MSGSITDGDWLGVTITHVTPLGLNLRSREEDWVEPWHAISDVQAARIPDGQSNMLVLAIGIRNERTILLAEFDPLWDELSNAIQRELPGTYPPSVWHARLVETGKFTVYDSDPSKA